MSFRCQRCGRSIRSGVKANTVVVETRRRTYEYQDGRPNGVGREIVKEIRVCPDCFLATKGV
jgi:hypothetical protein